MEETAAALREVIVALNWDDECSWLNIEDFPVPDGWHDDHDMYELLGMIEEYVFEEDGGGWHVSRRGASLTV